MKRIKYLFPLVFIVFLSLPLNAQQRDSTIRIKNMVVYQERYESLSPKKYKESEQNFDIKGNLTEDISYKQGKISRHFRYGYDANNNKIKEEKLDASGKVIETSEYKYANGLRIEKVVYNADNKIKSKRTYLYSIY
jgi:hypothetical protein